MPTISSFAPVSPRPRHFGSRTRLAAFLIAVGAVLAIGAFSVVQATLPATTTFKLDGYWDGNGSGTDWNNASGVVTYTDGTGAADDIFWTGGSKDVLPIEDWRWKTGPTPSQKTDLLNVSVRTETIEGDLYAFFSAVRSSSVGNAKIGFWILKDAVAAVGDDRFSGTHTIGDVLVDVDWITGSINTSGIRAYQWEGDSRNGPKRLTEHPLSTFGDCKTVNRSTATVCATVNTTSIASPWGSLAAGRFIEGAVNLTDTFGITTLGCGPTILAETRASGSSVMSSLEDFVGASLSNCSITITKSATDDTSVSFDYTAGGGITPTSFQLRSGQSRAMADVDNAAYTITEAAKAGWAMTSLSCTNSGNAVVGYSGNTVTVDFTNDRTGRVACTYVNRMIPTITVVKDIVPDDAVAQFALGIDGVTYTTTATDGTSTGAQYVTAGATHTVSETDGSGPADLTTFTTRIGCRKAGQLTDYTSASNVTGSERSLTLPVVNYGDRITCTITNSLIPTLTIVKQTSGANGTFDFTSATAAVGNFSLTTSANYAERTFMLSSTTGDVTVTESDKANWLLTDVSCDPSTGSGSYAVMADPYTRSFTIHDIGYRHVTCTFVNNAPGATRTQGFWSTHPQLAIATWSFTSGDWAVYRSAWRLPAVPASLIAMTSGDRSICGYEVTAGQDFSLTPSLVTNGTSELLGGFWASISKDSNGQPRGATDRSRMRFLQQYLAARLNYHLFGTRPTTFTFDGVLDAYCNAGDIDGAQRKLGAFNTSGDDVAFTPGGSAKPRWAYGFANIDIWDDPDLTP